MTLVIDANVAVKWFIQQRGLAGMADNSRIIHLADWT